MQKHKRESVLTVRLRTKLLIGITILIIALSLSGQKQHYYSGKLPEGKLPSFKLILLTEKNVFNLNEDIEIYVILKNEGWGGYISSGFFVASYHSERIPKNNLTIEVWDSHGNKILPKEVPIYYPTFPYAGLDYFKPLGYRSLHGESIHLNEDGYFTFCFAKPGIYTIQATLETECRKYIEERIKVGAIKENELGSDPKATLEKYINGTFKSNTIQIEIQK